MPVAVGQHADLAGDLAGREVANQPHLAGEAEAARHRAPHLRRDAEGHRRRVGDEDRLDPAAVRQLEHELSGAVDGAIVGDDLRRGDGEFARRVARASSATGRSSARNRSRRACRSSGRAGAHETSRTRAPRARLQARAHRAQPDSEREVSMLCLAFPSRCEPAIVNANRFLSASCTVAGRLRSFSYCERRPPRAMMAAFF